MQPHIYICEFESLPLYFTIYLRLLRNLPVLSRELLGNPPRLDFMSVYMSISAAIDIEIYLSVCSALIRDALGGFHRTYRS
jgi:hypothetical protein